MELLLDFFQSTGVAKIADLGWVLALKTLAMWVISCTLFYLAVVKKFEPLLLMPIGFGMLLANLPGANMIHLDWFMQDTVDYMMIFNNGGLLDMLYCGVKLGIYPPLIFLGIGAMTDFGPLIANPKTFFLSGAAQLGLFSAFIGALLLGFTPQEACAIGIIGSADGPTTIYVTKTLAPHLLGVVAIAAYSYMALVPIIQPPVMKLCTTKKERECKMEQMRPVTQTEKVIFPIFVTLVVALIAPETVPLIGMLMLGNFFKVSGVVDRLAKTSENELCNIITIFLAISVGATAGAEAFLTLETLAIIGLGLSAFLIATAAGVLLGRVYYYASGGKINPLIGSAAVSAIPMAARVSQSVAREANPRNFILMHAMGPNVSGVISSAIVAGLWLSMFG